MWKKKREQRTHLLEVLREDLVPMWYRSRTSSPTSSRTRESLMVKQSLMGRTRLCNTRTSRRRMARRKVLVMCVGILIIGLLVALIAMTSVILGKAARQLMLSLETLTLRMLGMVYFPLFFQYV